jgi:hypothetical protein
MSLFEKDNDFIRQGIAFSANGTPSLKTISIKKDDGSNTDITELVKTVDGIIDDNNNKDSIEKLEHLCCALLSPYDIRGFKVAWIMKTVLNKFQQDNNTNFSIDVESTELTKDDLKDYTIDTLKSFIKILEEDDSEVVNRLVDPTNKLGK